MVHGWDHLWYVWFRRWHIALFVGLVTVVAYVIASPGANRYAAEATVQISSAGADQGGVALQQDTVFLARSYADLALRPVVLDRVAAMTGVGRTELEDSLSVDASSTLGFIKLRAEASTADEATRLAGAFVQGLLETAGERIDQNLASEVANVDTEIAQVQEQLATLAPNSPQRAGLEAQLSSLLDVSAERRSRPRTQVRVVNPAQALDAPITTNPLPIALLAGTLALVVGAEGSIILDNNRGKRLSSRRIDQFARERALPVVKLGSLPTKNLQLANGLFVDLRTRLLHLDGSTGTTWPIVSTRDSATSAQVCIGLAATFAQIGWPVYVVDADLTDAPLAKMLHLAPTPGLLDALSAPNAIQHLQRVAGVPHVHLLALGETVGDPIACVSLGRLRHLVGELHRLDAGSVLVHVPAMNGADAVVDTILGELPTHFVLVADGRLDTLRSLEAACERVESAGGSVASICLNRPSRR